MTNTDRPSGAVCGDGGSGVDLLALEQARAFLAGRYGEHDGWAISIRNAAAHIAQQDAEIAELREELDSTCEQRDSLDIECARLEKIEAEIAGLRKGLSGAVIALAHAANANKTYQSAYERAHEAIDALAQVKESGVFRINCNYGLPCDDPSGFCTDTCMRRLRASRDE